MRDKSPSRTDEYAYFKLNALFLQELSLEEKRALAIVLFVKFHHTNSRIYNFSYDTIAKKLGLSRYIAKKYVDLIIEKGWGKISSDNDFVVHSFKVILERYQCKKHTIQVLKTDKISDIVEKLNFIIFKRNIFTQKYVQKLKSYEQYSRKDCDAYDLSLKKYKTLVRAKKEHPGITHGVFVDQCILGLRRIAELLKCSIGTASKFIKSMVSKNLIKAEEVKEKVAENIGLYYKDYMDESIGYYFRLRNNLYRHLGYSITIL